uniref:Uncharacterized protein n=1 Tax=Chromera velia CCMP2878 TaxID=1169474 RepID=A0A0G4HQ02_9ALVE|eukprot:Cvel_7836.t1-p1 / transcript=Cvel_7836.t1 / gene=Cvel_7836 / organism=Chromera_velia_CCMP2878 / gene_product=Zinc finger protein 283, putative / transcript_product=Zinc finger protein 283, putative / location=Cvel_scaffold419:16314-18336(-) / protein_length=628 / sequence_SO=supercontig / SO=protein_coding / is_pseudo=false
MVRVSELKFRLVALPNDGEIAETRDLQNLVCLEPLQGGDFRIVRLVGTSSPADCSSVGERGDNTIRVGVEGGGEQQATEVVGISVEWGVPESVQLALLPHSTNRQTEQSQKQNEYPCPPDTQSETACPTSSQGGRQRELGVFGSTDEEEGNSAVSLCPSQSSVEVRGSGSERGTGVAEKSPIMKTQTKENEKHFDCSESVDDCTCPSADSDSECRIPTFQPSTSTHLLPHDSTHDRRRKEEGDRAQVIPLKRRRSESGLSAFEADDCDDLSGCHGQAMGGALHGREGGVQKVPGGKQRRLTVSLSSDSAPLCSETCARTVEGKGCVSMAFSIFGARIVEGRASVSTVVFALNARSAGGRECVSTVEGAASAKIVGGRVCVSMVASALSARSAGGRAFVSTVQGAASERIAEGRASVSTAADALDARSVEGETSVSTVEGAPNAEIAGGRASVSTVAFVVSARIAGAKPSVSTVADALDARSVVVETSVSTVAFALNARSVEGRASVSMVGFALSARGVEVRASASTVVFVVSAKSAEGRASEHNRQRSKCKDCGGKSICGHGRIRRQCKECGGKGICEHNRQRSKCKECGGKSICVHGKERHHCGDCKAARLKTSDWKDERIVNSHAG